MPTFPATLPSPRAEGYTLSVPRHGLRSTIEAGEVRVRRRTAPRNGQAAASWSLSTSELAAFRAWAIGDGLDWCDITLAGPMGTETMSARLAGAWSARLAAPGTWTVSATLDIRQINLLDGEYLTAHLSYDPDALSGALSALHPWVAGQLAQGYYP